MIENSVEATRLRHEAQEQLLDAAEKALAMLDSRRTHHPPEMIDPREGRIAGALRTALCKVRDSEAQATEA